MVQLGKKTVQVYCPAWVNLSPVATLEPAWTTEEKYVMHTNQVLYHTDFIPNSTASQNCSSGISQARPSTITKKCEKETKQQQWYVHDY